MSLRKKTLAIPLTAGVERRNGGEDLTANLTALPAVPRAANLYRSRTGEWARRPGHTAIATNTAVDPFSTRTMSGFVGGASVGGQISLVTQYTRWRRADSAGVFEAASRVPDAAFGARLSMIDGVGTEKYQRDNVKSVAVAVGGGVAIVITESISDLSGAVSTVNVTAVKVDDESVIRRAGALEVNSTAQARVRAVYSAVSGKFVVFMTSPGLPSTAATNITAYVYSPVGLLSGSETLSAGTPVIVAADLIGSATSPNMHFDVMVEEDVGDVILAYRATGGDTKALRFHPANGSITTGPVTVVAGGDVAANSLAWMRFDVFPVAEYTLVTAINSVVGVVERAITKATLLQAGSTTIQASPGAVGSVIAWNDAAGTRVQNACWDVVDAVTQRNGITRAFKSGGAWTVAVSKDLSGCRFHGHPFPLQTGSPTLGWGAVLCTSILNAGKILMMGLTSWTSPIPASIVAEILNGEADSAPAAIGHLMDVARYGGEYFYGVVERTGAASSVTAAAALRADYSGVAHVARLSIQAAHANYVFIDPETALIPGSTWTKDDGEVFSGAPWPPAPAPAPASPAEIVGTSATGGLVRGRHLLVGVDTKGRRWSGPPSDESTLTLSGATKAWSHFATQVPSLSNGQVVLEFYKSKINSTQFFREFAYEYRGGSSPGTGLLFSSTAADSQLDTGLPLYTDGGELFHVSPPPSNCAWVAGTRILVADAQKPGTIWASSEFTPGEGPWFHPDVAISLPTSDEILAGAFMDGRSFVFTRKSIYALAGGWPGRSGLGQLPEAQRLAIGVGGYSPQSTLVTKEGVWFYSEDRGLCLLDRSLAVQTPGKVIDGVITSAPVAAVLSEKYDQVRFYLADGTYAAYDQVERQWSHGKVLGLGGALLTGAFVHNRDVYLYTNGALVLKEDAAALSDNGQAFPCEIDLRIPIGPPGGKARIYRAILSGLVTGATKLYCTVFNDFGQVGSDEDAKVMTVKARPGETLPALYEQTIKPKRGRCDSMLLRFSYLSTEGGITFRALAVEVGGYQPATVARSGRASQA
jgi:hypothetical protein